MFVVFVMGETAKFVGHQVDLHERCRWNLSVQQLMIAASNKEIVAVFTNVHFGGRPAQNVAAIGFRGIHTFCHEEWYLLDCVRQRRKVLAT